MNHEVKEATREWEQEVDRETVKLIREGIAPYDAVERARRIVERRRAARAQKEESR